MAELITISRELLNALAPNDPLNQDERGGCVWCGATDGTAYGYIARGMPHENSCAWYAARVLLGDSEA